MAINPDKLMAFMGKLVGDLGAMMSIGPMIVGEKLGLYKTMADGVPINAAQLAARTNTDERYVREWLCAQAASGFIEYDDAAAMFSMTEEQAAALGAEGGPFYFLGAIEVAVAMVRDEPQILEAFRTGKGVGWHEHDLCLFRGTERFFRQGYMRHLLSEWIPALDGVKERLEAGGRVADVGCGSGEFSAVLGKIVGPSGHVYCVDVDDLKDARRNFKRHNVRNIVLVKGLDDDPKLKPGSVDAVLIVNAYHEMPKWDGMLRHLREALKPGGNLVICDNTPHRTAARPRESQTKNHVIAEALVATDLEASGFRILRRDAGFIDDPDSESQHWLIVATPK